MHNIKFNSEIADIAVNRRVVVVSFVEKLAVFDACNLEARFTITSCYPSPGVHGNPISLGDRQVMRLGKIINLQLHPEYVNGSS